MDGRAKKSLDRWVDGFAIGRRYEGGMGWLLDGQMDGWMDVWKWMCG